jgi:hypothetical protein
MTKSAYANREIRMPFIKFFLENQSFLLKDLSFDRHAVIPLLYES